MRRLVLLSILLALLVPAPAALAQSNPFGPLPPAAQPTAAPTPVSKTSSTQNDISRGTLLLIGLGVAAVFVFIGVAITRDARSSLTEDDRLALERGGTAASAREQRNKAKAKARQKGRAQRQARKRTRR